MLDPEIAQRTFKQQVTHPKTKAIVLAHSLDISWTAFYSFAKFDTFK